MHSSTVTPSVELSSYRDQHFKVSRLPVGATEKCHVQIISFPPFVYMLKSRVRGTHDCLKNVIMNISNPFRVLEVNKRDF